MRNYLFETKESMDKALLDFINKVRLTKQDRNCNEFVLKNASIGIFSNNDLIDTDISFMGIKPYIRRSFNSLLCGVHPKIWIINDFYGEFCKSKNDCCLQRIEEKYYAEILSSLEPKGEIITFSLKKDYNELQSRYKEFSKDFVFDILSKEHFNYKNVEYNIKI